MAIGMTKEQQQIADANRNYLEGQAVERGEMRRQAEIDYEEAQRGNTSQPRGRWDAGSQTFTPDGWDSALRDQETARQRQFFGDVIGGRRAAMDEIGEVADMDRRMKAMVQLDLNNYMAGAVKYSDGGVLPDSVRNFINRRMTEKYRQFGLRFDGQSTGILPGSGFAQDGSYVFKLGNGTDQRGNALTQDQVLDGRQLHSLMYMHRESFGDDALERSRQTLRGNGLSSKEIAALEQDPISDDIREKIAAGATYGTREARWEMQHRPITNADSLRAKGFFGDGGAGGRNIGGTTDGKATSRLFGRTGWVRPTGITQTGFGTDGNGGTVKHFKNWDTGETWSEYGGTRNPDYGGRWKVIESNADGKRYVNDKTGEETFVPKGKSISRVVSENDPRVIAAQKAGDARLALAGINNESKERMAADKEAGRNARQNAWLDERRASRLVGQAQKEVDRLTKLMKDEFDEKKKAGYAQQIKDLQDDIAQINGNVYRPTGGKEQPATEDSALDAMNGGAKGGAERNTQTQAGNDAKRKELEAAEETLKRRKAASQDGGAEGLQTQSKGESSIASSGKASVKQQTPSKKIKVAEAFGIDQEFVDKLKKEDPDFDENDISTNMNHSWSGESKSSLGKLLNYARIEGRDDIVKKLTNIYSEADKKKKINANAAAWERANMASKQADFEYQAELDSIPSDVRKEAIRKGKDKAWIEKEIKSRTRDAERRRRVSGPKFDINGNPY